MDEDIKTNEDLFENIPQEVKRYIYSTFFLDSLKRMIAAEQLESLGAQRLKGALYGYLAQTETEDGLLQTIHSVSKSIESSQRIIDWIKKEVTEKVLDLVVDSYMINEDEETEDEITKEESLKLSSPQQALPSIQERLTKPVTVAPITRDYSVARAPEPSTPKADIAPAKSSMDIYREVPDR